MRFIAESTHVGAFVRCVRQVRDPASGGQEEYARGPEHRPLRLRPMFESWFGRCDHFAKLVEVFEGQGVSFVSVTQQFNTTTSMGRLMLNVLLSFAQFEK